MVLGTPVGSDAYKLQQLQHTRDQHHFLLQRLPDLEGLQAAWLLLLFCANPHCHYNLRMPPPTSQQPSPQNTMRHLQPASPTFWTQHQCQPLHSQSPASLSTKGGLGLALATILAPSAYWASWADAILVLLQQSPEAFAQLLQQLQADHIRSHALEATQRAATAIQTYGSHLLDWQHIADGVAPPRFHHNFEDGIALGRGWQQKAATPTHTAFQTEVRDRLDLGNQALLESQTGPHASRAFTTILPTMTTATRATSSACFS